MPEPTVLAALPAALLEAARALGHDADGLRQRAGISPEALDDPDGRIPLGDHVRLWTVLSSLGGNIGLELGQLLGGRGLGVVGFAMKHGGSVRDALDVLGRFRALVLDPAIPTLAVRKDGSGWVACFTQVVPPPFLSMRHPAETQMASTLTALRALTGRTIRPERAAFPHAAPRETSAHRALFGKQLSWRAPAAELIFQASVLDLPIVGADPTLAAYLTRRADALLGELSRPESMVDATRRQIGLELSSGEPSAAGIARKLGSSARTLQRRLKEEGSSFSRLLEEVRRDRAIALLEGGRLLGYEVAFLLGYKEASAFFRAFRRWTGATPDAFRKRGKGS
jgi:AraC-like DNA-binding protein